MQARFVGVRAWFRAWTRGLVGKRLVRLTAVLLAVLSVATLPAVQQDPAVADTVTSNGSYSMICSGDTVQGAGTNGYGTITIPAGFQTVTSGTATINTWPQGSDLGVGRDPTNSIDMLWGTNLTAAGTPVTVTLSAETKSWPNGAVLPINVGGVGVSSVVSASITVTILDAQGNPWSGPCHRAHQVTESFGCSAAEPQGSKVHGSGCDPVDTQSGNFHQDFTDFDLGGRGDGLRMTRSYNSLLADQSANEGVFGWGWASSLDMHLKLNTPNPGDITVVQENGNEVWFSLAGSTYVVPPRIDATLVATGSGYAFKRMGSDTFQFDSTGRLQSRTDRNGLVTSYGYTNSRVTSLTDPAGRTITLNWTGSNLTSASDQATPSPRTVTYQYNDGAGNLTDVIDVAGGHWQFTYDANHRMTKVRTPNQYVATTPKDLVNSFDTQGRVFRQVDQLGRVTDLDYSSIVNATKVTLPQMSTSDTRRFVRVDTYDPVTTARTAITSAYGTADAATWTYTYDPYSYGVKTVVDPYHNVVEQNSYDAYGNVLSTQNAVDPPSTVSGYNSFNEPLDITDPAGVKTTFVYDSFGNLKSRSTPLLDVNHNVIATQTTAFSYDTTPGRQGDLLTITDPTSQLWTLSYDTSGNRTSLTEPITPENPAGNTTTWTYDNVGRILTTVAPKGNVAGTPPSTTAKYTTTYTTDNLGAVTSATDGNSHVSSRHFDADHNQDWLQDPNQLALGVKTSYTYNAADELTQVTRADATTLQNSYYGDGSLKTQVDGGGNTTSYTYDAAQRMISVTTPPTPTAPTGQTTAYGYDLAGRLHTKTAPGGSCLTPVSGCTTYGYTLASELSSVTYSDPATPSISTITYDPDGRRQTMVSSAGTAHWGWDSLGRLTESDSPADGGVARAVRYGWDLNNNLTSIAYPGGSCTATPTVLCVQRTFDNASRLQSVTDWNASQSTFSYDNDSNQASTTFPASTRSNDVYAYGFTDTMTSAAYKTGSTSNQQLTYAPDPANQLSTMSQSGLPGNTGETYGYDKIERLTSVKVGTTTSTYSYATGDTLTKLLDGTQQVSDPASELCYSAPAGTSSGTCTTPPAAATIYGYNPQGDRTSVTPPASSGATPSSFNYDQADRMTAATVGASASPTGQYTPITPTRILDTRSGSRTGLCPTASSQCTQIAAGGTLSLQVTGQGGVPANGAAAVALNVTAVNTTGSGTLIVYPADIPMPATSNLNFVGGQTIANQVTAKLSASGQLSITVGQSTTDVIVDVYGWFAAPAGTIGGTFTALNPARILDTRTSTRTGLCPTLTSQCVTLPAGGSLTFQVAGRGGVPASGVSAVELNVTVVPSATSGYLTMWPAGGPQPATSTLNFSANQILSESATAQLSTSGQATIKSSASTDLIVDIFGWYSSAPAAGGQVFSSETPTRLLDTRPPAVGTCDGGCATIPAGGTLVVTVAGKGGVPPTGVSAVAVNITAVNSAAAGSHSLVAYAHGATIPSATLLTELPGQPVANAGIVALGSDGKISISSGSATDVLVDIEGWYSAQTTWTYAYDADGLRATKAGPLGTTSYSWDRSAVVPRILSEATGSAFSYYLYGPNGLPFEQINSGGSNPGTLYYHYDQLGSIRTVTNAAGTTVETISFDPYGRILASNHTGIMVPFGYAGGYTDAETGLVYLLNRYYDPNTGGFLTRDPVDLLTRQHFNYAADNPITYVDPGGLFMSDPWGWIKQHRNTIVTVLAVGTCLASGTLAICAVVSSGALAVRVQQRGRGHVGEDIADATMTWVTLGMGGAFDTLAKEGLIGSEAAVNALEVTGRAVPAGYDSAAAYPDWLMSRCK